MEAFFDENAYENALMELFQELGYECVRGSEVERDLQEPLLPDRLEAALRRINPDLPDEAIREALRRLLRPEAGESLIVRNMRFTDWMQNGVEVSFHAGGEPRAALVRLVDHDDIGANDLLVARQWTFRGHLEKRPDMAVFLNGMPVVVIELKSPAREGTDASDGYRQIRAYLHEIPSFFASNAFCVISDMITSKAGTITAGEDRFMEWKSVDGGPPPAGMPRHEVFFRGIFEKGRLLGIIRGFICFDVRADGPAKILAGYHQHFAVLKAVARAREALEHGDGRGGVFWHTQGSGKSLSMVFYAHALQRAMDGPTIVVLTDRNDLDDQLYGQFCRCRGFLRQDPVQAADRRHLRRLLAGREANGIIFTTMQKFELADDALSERRSIVVMADEAHRGQYGLTERTVIDTGPDGEITGVRTRVGAARIIRNSLPNAIYVGFTGTPVSGRDRDTREVFGDYVDVYDMTQAVEDGATRPIYYESRAIHIDLDREALARIDAEYARMEEEADPWAVERSKSEMAQLDAILGAERTVASLADDIVAHYEGFRADLLTGKAMIVAHSRSMAVKLHRRLLEVRPDWTEKIAAVMTGSNDDPEEWRRIVGNRAHRDELAARFKDNGSPLKIAIVVDMWLTGFDVPSLATMYVCRPMRGHSLMQAAARVNRVFRDKEGGLLVDYVGIASALKRAMRDYTRRDRELCADMDVGGTALLRFREKLGICRDLLHGFPLHGVSFWTDAEKAAKIMGAMDFILAREAGEQDRPERERTRAVFVGEALAMRQALSLCGSLAGREERLTAGFLDAVRMGLVRLASVGSDRKLSLKEINGRICELLRHCVTSQGVILLHEGGRRELSLLDPQFLRELAGMRERNLAMEMLKRLLKQRIAVFQRTNLVRSRMFSEMLAGTLNRYVNGLISNEEVIAELLKIAEEIAASPRPGDLSDEELAFYDALARPGAVRDFYDDAALVAMTRELTETLRRSRTIDWRRKESARADMRRMVRRLLKRHGYPPECVPEALETVIAQCELWADSDGE